MSAKPDYNESYLVVHPKGRYGKNDRWEIEDMKEKIERHVDNVDYVEIKFDNWICSDCDSYYETEEEAENCFCTDEGTL
jgi:hypothetical protein